MRTPAPLVFGLICVAERALCIEMCGTGSGMSGAIGQGSGGILLVDDDRDLVGMLAYLVEQAGYTPICASEPAVALELFDTNDPLVAIVDLNLTPSDGFELLAELRRRSATLGIIVLTGRLSEDDKVRALDLGADDYVVKPFGHRELLARIRAQVRRACTYRREPAPALLQVGPLRLDVREQTLELDGKRFRLAGTEFRLLRYLMEHRDAVVPTSALVKNVWGHDDVAARDVARVTVYRLRRKIGSSGSRHFIHTVPGVGLKLGDQ